MLFCQYLVITITWIDVQLKVEDMKSQNRHFALKICDEIPLTITSDKYKSSPLVTSVYELEHIR
jgi:hypothetical protein